MFEDLIVKIILIISIHTKKLDLRRSGNFLNSFLLNILFFRKKNIFKYYFRLYSCKYVKIKENKKFFERIQLFKCEKK